MLIDILIGLAVVIVVFVVIIATQPADFRVTRATTIAAPAEVVFAQVNDLHQWEAWSPWAKLDPACKNSYAGSPAGTGGKALEVGVAGRNGIDRLRLLRARASLSGVGANSRSQSKG